MDKANLCNLCNCAGTILRRALNLVSHSVPNVLIVLISLSLNLYFLSEVLWDNGECAGAKEMYPLGICHSLPPHSLVAS
jgi:hypothetical protein